MPAFGATSLSRLQTCHPDLVRLFAEVVRIYDCTVIEGHRTASRQAELVKSGASKTNDSKHLAYPSLAVDVAPYPVEWPDKLLAPEKDRRQSWGRWYVFAGIVFATAERMGVKVRWGGSWDGDMDPRHNRFDDLPHWDLVT